MILVDANLALYAYDRSSPRHGVAREWFESTLNSDERVGFALVTVLAFVRIITSRAVYRRPMPVSQALGVVREWLDRPNVAIAEPTERHWERLATLATSGQAKGALVMDAHLAALALEHGAAVATTDRDFRRFPGLRVIDPVA
jgi:toxin-antitoxin system PIN domain toxin